MYSQFLNMIPEAALIAALVLVFITDFVFAKKNSRISGIVSGVLMLAVCFVCVAYLTFAPAEQELFGGMYVTTKAVTVMKVILSAGTFIVLLQSRLWLSREG